MHQKSKVRIQTGLSYQFGKQFSVGCSHSCRAYRINFIRLAAPQVGDRGLIPRINSPFLKTAVTTSEDHSHHVYWNRALEFSSHSNLWWELFAYGSRSRLDSSQARAAPRQPIEIKNLTIFRHKLVSDESVSFSCFLFLFPNEEEQYGFGHVTSSKLWSHLWVSLSS